MVYKHMIWKKTYSEDIYLQSDDNMFMSCLVRKIILLLTSCSNQYYLMGSHKCLNDHKSPKVSRTPLGILAGGFQLL